MLRQLVIGIKIFNLIRLRNKTFFIFHELLTMQEMNGLHSGSPLLLLSRANPAVFART
jgi:hypothetical protein